KQVKGLFVLLLLLRSLLASAQYENVWVFGHSNKLDFNSGYPPVASMLWWFGSDNTSMGPAAVCGRDGQLLFFTDGSQVLNRNNGIMPNGTNLTFITGSTHKMISMSLIVPFPDSEDKYYVFSLQAGYSL